MSRYSLSPSGISVTLNGGSVASGSTVYAYQVGDIVVVNGYISITVTGGDLLLVSVGKSAAQTAYAACSDWGGNLCGKVRINEGSNNLLFDIQNKGNYYFQIVYRVR